MGNVRVTERVCHGRDCPAEPRVPRHFGRISSVSVLSLSFKVFPFPSFLAVLAVLATLVPVVLLVPLPPPPTRRRSQSPWIPSPRADTHTLSLPVRHTQIPCDLPGDTISFGVHPITTVLVLVFHIIHRQPSPTHTAVSVNRFYLTPTSPHRQIPLHLYACSPKAFTYGQLRLCPGQGSPAALPGDRQTDRGGLAQVQEGMQDLAARFVSSAPRLRLRLRSIRFRTLRSHSFAEHTHTYTHSCYVLLAYTHLARSQVPASPASPLSSNR